MDTTALQLRYLKSLFTQDAGKLEVFEHQFALIWEILNDAAPLASYVQFKVQAIDGELRIKTISLDDCHDSPPNPSLDSLLQECADALNHPKHLMAPELFVMRSSLAYEKGWLKIGSDLQDMFIQTSSSAMEFMEGFFTANSLAPRFLHDIQQDRLQMQLTENLPSAQSPHKSKKTL